jgi:Holliday junction resolvase RusA-like endonuclease
MEYPEIYLPLRLMSKARPRVTRFGAYMPKPYQDWRKECVELLKEAWPYDPIDHPISVSIECAGAARGDVDNYMGAFFDAANKILWVDDRCSIIKSACISHTKAKLADSYWKIRICDL